MKTAKALSILFLIASTTISTLAGPGRHNQNANNNPANNHPGKDNHGNPGRSDDADDDDDNDEQDGNYTLSDQQFLSKAAADSLLEIALGQLAQSQSTTPSVQQFGQQLVTDHTAALQQVQQLAASLGITLLPPDGSDADILSMLSQLSGAEFDRAFLALEIKDHAEDIHLFTLAATMASDPAVRALAASQLPVLAQHYQMALSIWQTLGLGPLPGGDEDDDDHNGSGDDNDENED